MHKDARKWTGLGFKGKELRGSELRLHPKWEGFITLDVQGNKEMRRFLTLSVRSSPSRNEAEAVPT